MDVKSITSCSDGCELAIEFSQRHGKHTTLGLAVWKTSDLQPDNGSIHPLGRFETLRAKVEHVIGAVGRKLYYLDKSLWLCHVDLEGFQGEYYRHFFLSLRRAYFSSLKEMRQQSSSEHWYLKKDVLSFLLDQRV